MNFNMKMKQGLRKNVFTQYSLWFHSLCKRYKRVEHISIVAFVKKNFPHVFVFKAKSVSLEFYRLLSKIDIKPVATRAA